MSLDLPVTARVLALLFAVHNVEEFVHLAQDRERALERVPAGSRVEEWYRPDSMAVALMLLTGLAGGLLALPAEDPDPVGDGVAVVGSTALAFNAVTHVTRAAAERRYNGGLLTAPLMFATAVELRRRVNQRTALSRRARAVLTGVGLAAVPTLIVASLELGRRLTTGCRG